MGKIPSIEKFLPRFWHSENLRDSWDKTFFKIAAFQLIFGVFFFTKLTYLTSYKDYLFTC